MASSNDVTLPAVKRSRKSLGAPLSRTMDKENATIDVGTTLAASRRKSRSKSIGPGGLDSLRQAHGNRRASLAAPPNAPRSILKPTIAPLPEIPPLKKGRKSPSSAGKASARATAPAGPAPAGPDLGGSKIALKTEEEQQAAAREREERDRRDARRKSLANRRVSFAAEATLHTFHEVEQMNDANASKSQSDPSSAENQAKRARDSLASHSSFNAAQDDTAASIYSSDSEPADAVEEIPADEEEEDSNSDLDDGTMMTVVTEEITGTTAGSDGSADEAEGAEAAEESSTLDEALRMAAQRAATQQVNGDSDDGEEIIPSFGWAKKPSQPSLTSIQQSNPITSAPTPDFEEHDGDEEADMDVDMEMEMTRPVGKIIRGAFAEASEEYEQEQEMTMEVTRALGGILPQGKGKHASEDFDAPLEEATMEFTTAIGGINRFNSTAANDFGDDDGNEDMSMELTTIMGGLLKAKNDLAQRRKSEAMRLEDATMDMTSGLGRILSNAQQGSDEEGDQSMAMDEDTIGMGMTMAVGGIIQNDELRAETSEDNWLLGNSLPRASEAGNDNYIASTTSQASQASPAEIALPSTTTGLITAGIQALRRSIGSPFLKSPGNGAQTPSGSPANPKSKESTPKQALAPPNIGTTPRSSPMRTPQSASKGRLPRRASSRTPSPKKAIENSRRSFSQVGPNSGLQPTEVLTPQRRSPAKLDVSRDAFGSPQVAAIFERRGSLVDSASKFVPGKRIVGFVDPRQMMEEVEKEDQQQREDSSQRSPGRRSGATEEKDATLNLREMIDSLSPKRNPLKGRKSLHVGSARGLLGKRPLELDDEESGDVDGPKRLKRPQDSPVKSVKLQQPPSKEETMGDLINPFRRSAAQVGGANLLSVPFTPLTPSGQSPTAASDDEARPEESQTAQEADAEPTVDHGALQEEARNSEKIHLQDFLNMTSIRFMELTTTKRRPTMMPAAFQHGESGDEEDLSLERLVVAGACTVPMLELYQHSCRELKKYISEGRKIVKEIETETLEENPMLFQEYMSATPEVKAVMDNQFKNVKAHARHLSKAMWYEWRVKLQDGLKEGLISITDGMESDEKLLAQEEQLLASVMPDLMRRHEALLKESSVLEEAARELADCDPVQLQSARDELVALGNDVAEKKTLIAKLRQELEESEAEVGELTAQKQQCLAEIQEAEAVREECRGWTCSEVNSLKERVDAIREEHGWTVTGISGCILSLTYRREIELVLDATSFQLRRPSSRIDLWYIGDRRERDAQPKTVEKEFFLQCIRDHVRALPQSHTKMGDVLDTVRRAWDKANLVSQQVRRINVSFPTRVARTSDSSIAMTSSLLLRPLETRVEITLHLSGASGPGGVDVEVLSEAKVVYGEQFNEGKVGEFLATRIGRTVEAAGERGGGWNDVVLELHGKLIARGQK